MSLALDSAIGRRFAAASLTDDSRTVSEKDKMRSHPQVPTVLGALIAAVALLTATPSRAFDEEAAKALFKKNDCTKCHAPAKTKKGPSLKKIAEENKGKPDIEAKLIKHLTTGPKVKLEDGTEEEHKIIETKDKAELKNLIEWILAQ
ncbi:MAG TPA: c-type cytochrome [Rhodocyclaceae bacterium]|nr:c-type cytochrome [Rhodocyclaceae bacterium]